MVELQCPCAGQGWVCEAHHDRPWGEGDACCGAAGMPCLVCNGGDPPKYPPGSSVVWDFKNNPPGPRAVRNDHRATPLLDQPSLRSAVSRYTFVPTNPDHPKVESDDTIDAMKFGGAPGYTVPFTRVPLGTYHFSDATDAPEFTVLDHEEPVDRGIVLAGDKQAYDAISRRLFRASARQSWGQSVTDEELQDEALDDLYHELGITREDP